MELKELIKKYGLRQTEKFTRNGVVYEDSIVVDHVTLAKKDNVIEEIKEKKQEILEYFKQQREEENKTFEERQKKISEIEGLEEIESAMEDYKNWKKEFNESFDNVGGHGVRQMPEYDFDALYNKYPVAKAYLAALNYSEKENVELSAIGKKALERIIYHQDEYKVAIEEMKKELKEFTEKHIFD